MESYVHVLLFRCQECGSPIVATVMSDRQNPEEVDAAKLELRCDSGHDQHVPAATATRHWAARWSS